MCKFGSSKGCYSSDQINCKSCGVPLCKQCSRSLVTGNPPSSGNSAQCGDCKKNFRWPNLQNQSKRWNHLIFIQFISKTLIFFMNFKMLHLKISLKLSMRSIAKLNFDHIDSKKHHFKSDALTLNKIKQEHWLYANYIKKINEKKKPKQKLQ